MSHPVFEIVTTTAGAISIRNKLVNEIMHNPVGPWVEANKLYIDQSNLRARCGASSEFVLWDVGLGAGANALAALTCVQALSPHASLPLRLISFERDLELLKFAVAHAEQFPHFDGFAGPIRQFLETGLWRHDAVVWELRHGEFPELVDCEKTQPNLIFFDPYSPDVNPEMWTFSCFEKIRKKCRSSAEGGTDLYTYSQATRIRAALIAAGFFVGYGDSTGLKAETTAAATDLGMLKKPLAQPWYKRWQKSHLRHPTDLTSEQHAPFDLQIQTYFHKQAASFSQGVP